MSKRILIIVVFLLAAAGGYYALRDVPPKLIAHAEHSEEKKAGADEHENGVMEEEFERGPHKGRMLRKNGFALELTIFEDGVQPQFRVFAYQNDKPVDPAKVRLTVELKRLTGAVNHFNFTPQNNFLAGDAAVAEPHSFDVTVAAVYGGENYGWSFPSYEGHTVIAMHAMRIPSTALSEPQAMQIQVEKAVSSFKEVAFVYSKTGTAEMAADPMPPNVSDTFIILKPQEEWPDPSLTKPELIARIEEAVQNAPGNNYEFSQPIQMRFNELISGVRSDVAVKLYGDDFAVMEKNAAEILRALQAVDGAADAKVEQTRGLPFLEIRLDKPAIARFGLNVSDVLDVITIAIGGREAGLVFQGNRRFDILVRLPGNMRQDLSIIKNLPVLLPVEEDGRDESGITPHSRPRYLPLREVAQLEMVEGPNQISRENGKRRVVIQANVRGRDIGSFVDEAQAAIYAKVKLPAGYWLEWGGQFKNLQEASQRLMIVVPPVSSLFFCCCLRR